MNLAYEERHVLLTSVYAITCDCSLAQHSVPLPAIYVLYTCTSVDFFMSLDCRYQLQHVITTCLFTPGPKFLGSWAAVSSGQLNSSTATISFGDWSSSSSGTNTCTASSSSRNSQLPACAACSACEAAEVPAVFQGSGDEAVQALEGVVLRHLAGKRHLTLMQLQRGIQAVSLLDSPFQLAAIGVLLRGGCWLAAMQVSMQAVLHHWKCAIHQHNVKHEHICNWVMNTRGIKGGRGKQRG